MNYKNNGVREFQEFAKQHPDYSLGEIFYAIARTAKVNKISDLLEKTDEEMFTAINKAIEVEHEIVENNAG